MLKRTLTLQYQIKPMFFKLKTLCVCYKPMLKKCLILKKLKNSMSENFIKSVLIFKTMSYKPLISKSCNKPMLENSFTSAP